jgi:hypothetical protein
MGTSRRQLGRMEKRLPIAIVVNLAPINGQSASQPELTYTDNISAHGACIVSSRSWNPGELAEVVSLKDKIALRGKVVHCERRSDARYIVGLSFNGLRVTWATYRTYAGT